MDLSKHLKKNKKFLFWFLPCKQIESQQNGENSTKLKKEWVGFRDEMYNIYEVITR